MCACVWIFVWTCVNRRCFYQGVERSLHEFKTAAFSSKSRWAHLSCVQNQNNTWQLWQLWQLTQLQCFCLIRSRGVLSLRQTTGLNWSETKIKICIFPFWIRFHFQFSWRSARNAVTRWIYFYCQNNILDFSFPCKTHFMTKLSSFYC